MKKVIICAGLLGLYLPSYALTKHCVPHSVIKVWPNQTWQKGMPDYTYDRVVMVKHDGKCVEEKETCGVFLDEGDRRFLAEQFTPYKDEQILTDQMTKHFIGLNVENSLAAFVVVSDFLQHKDQLGSTIGDLRKRLNLPTSPQSTYNEFIADSEETQLQVDQDNEKGMQDETIS